MMLVGLNISLTLLLGLRGKTQLMFPFAVSCNFLKVFSVEECELDVCLGSKLEFRCYFLYSGSLNLHFFCRWRNCIFYKCFWQTGRVLISPEFRGVLHDQHGQS